MDGAFAKQSQSGFKSAAARTYYGDFIHDNRRRVEGNLRVKG